MEKNCDSVDEIPGVTDVQCDVQGPPGIPSYLKNIIFFEGNGDEYIRVDSSQKDSPFSDWATITDTSILADGGEDTIVKGYRIEATGVLDDGQEQQMYVHIHYSNECTGIPVFSHGDTFAWFTFDANSAEGKLDQFCPIPETATKTEPAFEDLTSSPQPLPEENCLDVDFVNCSFEFNQSAYSCDEWVEQDFGCVHDISLKYNITNTHPDARPVIILNGTGPFENIPLEDKNEVSPTAGITILNEIIEPGPGNSTMGNHTLIGENLCTLDKDISVIITNSESQELLPIDQQKKCKVAEASITLPKETEAPSVAPSEKPSVGPGKGSKACKSTGKGKGKGTASKSSKSCSYYEYECTKDVSTKSPKSTKSTKSIGSTKSAKAIRRVRVLQAVDDYVDDAQSPSIADGDNSSAPTPSLSPVKSQPSKTCEECYDLMGSDVDVPQDAELADVSYVVKIVTKSNKEKLPNGEVKIMFLDTMNGFFKAELLGCNFATSRRKLETKTFVDLRTAEFNDDLSFAGDAAEGEQSFLAVSHVANGWRYCFVFTSHLIHSHDLIPNFVSFYLNITRRM